MKVGLVCPYAWDVPGGVRSHVADLAVALGDHGHEVSVLAPVDEPADLPAYVVDGGRPISVRYNGSVARLSIGVRATRRVRNWVREGDFDIVHVHEPMAPSLSMLALWASRGPLVATWHSSHDRSRVLAAGYYLAQTVMEKVRGRIAVSEDARRTLVAHVGGDAVLIPNGVRVAAFAGLDRLPDVDPDRPSALFLGRMDESRKGLAVLWEALPAVLEAVPDLQLLVAGPGDVEEQLEDIPAGAEANVRFLGFISDEDKARALRSVDVYVAPHTGGESFGIVLVEAMAAQASVLASDLPAFRRVLADGECGRLFANQDPVALSQGLIELLADPSLRARYVAAADRRVRDFDWDRVVDDVIAVYDSVRTPGEKVTEDLRGQLVGRLNPRGDAAARSDGP
ncbi:MAG: phosphatidyl-myo-inositol alpha-mannosyltransferase [Actinomycetota bacterium]|jgi:phosphatidylinositol alpha-mannosyltransferase|nr:phosphatidyl-myo-inositol alpha-mannosyltransferase [Actinomycetota bacterium]